MCKLTSTVFDHWTSLLWRTMYLLASEWVFAAYLWRRRTCHHVSHRQHLYHQADPSRSDRWAWGSYPEPCSCEPARTNGPEGAKRERALVCLFPRHLKTSWASPLLSKFLSETQMLQTNTKCTNKCTTDIHYISLSVYLFQNVNVQHRKGADSCCRVFTFKKPSDLIQMFVLFSFWMSEGCKWLSNKPRWAGWLDQNAQ